MNNIQQPTFACRWGQYWMLRAFLALSVLGNCLVAFLEPRSMNATMLHADRAAWLFMSVLTVLAVVALLDVLVNDTLPPRFKLPIARDLRHYGYISIAIATVAFSYAVARGGGGVTAWLLPYWLDAAVAATIAFLDLFARHRGAA